MQQRYVLEGEWTGYRSSQQRVVHREVVTQPLRVARLRKLHAIRYTDGTSLLISIREAEHRERVKEINSYGSLIREAETQEGSTVLVANLPSVKKTADEHQAEKVAEETAAAERAANGQFGVGA